MAIVICRICDGKQFKNEAAYAQHARDNKTHRTKAQMSALQQKSVPATPACRPSPRSAHTVLAPPPSQAANEGWCKACKTDYGDAQNLQFHYERGETRWHPKCLKCGKGFENHAVLEEHRKSAHPMIYCQKCKKYAYLEDWAKHQAECSKPVTPPPPPPPPRPMWSCPVCSALESSEEDVKKHIVALHPELCCYTCGLAFQSGGELSAHYLQHDAHPTCSPCGLGFRGDLEFHLHIEEKHAPSSPEVGFACEDCEREFTSAEEYEQHNESHRVTTLATVPEWDEDEDPFHSESSAGSPLDDVKGKGVDRGTITKPERIVPRAGHTMPLTLSKAEEGCYSDVSSDSVVQVASAYVPSVPKLLRASSAPVAPTVFTAPEVKPVILNEIVASPEPWTNVHLNSASSEEQGIHSGSPQGQAQEPDEAQRSESESPVLVQTVETEQATTGSPLSSRSASTASTSYHSAARVPSPSRAISRLSLYTAYRHPTGNSPAPESSSVASPGSAHSLLFTLSQSMKGKRTESPSSAASASAEQSPEMPPRFSFAPASPRQPSTPTLSDEGVPNPRIIHVGEDTGTGVSASATTVSLTRTEESTVTYREEVSAMQSQARTTVTAPEFATTSTAASEEPDQGYFEASNGLHSQSPPRESAKAPSIRFQCRACNENPVEPTVTMCGHLFCRSCIVAEISKNLQCPVCRTVMLVRLFVD